jgi:hypothetical protein
MPPVAISVAVPARTECTGCSRCQHLRVEPEQTWRLVSRAGGILGPYGEAIDAGAIKAGHVHRREHVARQHAAAGAGQGHHLLANWFKPEMRMEAPFRLVTSDDVEELLLTCGTAEGLDRDLAVHGSISHAVPLS